MEVKISNLETLREQLEEDMRGLCMCDYITKQDKINYLNDFDEWSKTAKNGDTYFAQEFSYTYYEDNK